MRSCSSLPTHSTSMTSSACMLILAALSRAAITAKDFRSAADFDDRRKWTPGRRIRFSAGWGTLLTNDFRGCDPGGNGGFDPISLICKVSSAEGRPAVKLSDNYAKALGLPSEIERYRRVFGTAGLSNTPVTM